MSRARSSLSARFVRSAWALLGFQLLAAAAATALAVWAFAEVRILVEERDRLRARVVELEAAQPAPVAIMPAVPLEAPAIVPDRVAPAPARPVVTEPSPPAVRPEPADQEKNATAVADPPGPRAPVADPPPRNPDGVKPTEPATRPLRQPR